MSNLFKYIKYILILIIVACGSSSKEVDFQELSINAVKNELLDPNSFELIKYSLDTTFLHEELLRKIGNDSLEMRSAQGGLEIWEDMKNDYGKDNYEEYLVKLKDAEKRIDSNLSLLNSVPDSIFEFRGYIRYYANSKGGMRVINQMGIYFDSKGLVINTISLD